MFRHFSHMQNLITWVCNKLLCQIKNLIVSYSPTIVVEMYEVCWFQEFLVFGTDSERAWRTDECVICIFVCHKPFHFAGTRHSLTVFFFHITDHIWIWAKALFWSKQRLCYDLISSWDTQAGWQQHIFSHMVVNLITQWLTGFMFYTLTKRHIVPQSYNGD